MPMNMMNNRSKHLNAIRTEKKKDYKKHKQLLKVKMPLLFPLS